MGGEASVKVWGVIALLVTLGVVAMQYQGQELLCKLDKDIYYRDQAAAEKRLEKLETRMDGRFDQLEKMLRDLMRRDLKVDQ